MKKDWSLDSTWRHSATLHTVSKLESRFQICAKVFFSGQPTTDLGWQWRNDSVLSLPPIPLPLFAFLIPWKLKKNLNIFSTKNKEFKKKKIKIKIFRFFSICIFTFLNVLKKNRKKKKSNFFFVIFLKIYLLSLFHFELHHFQMFSGHFSTFVSWLSCLLDRKEHGAKLSQPVAVYTCYAL